MNRVSMTRRHATNNISYLTAEPSGAGRSRGCTVTFGAHLLRSTPSDTITGFVTMFDTRSQEPDPGVGTT